MKKIFYVVCALSVILLSSCVSMLLGNNFATMAKERPADVSEYCDYHLKNIKLPDGKVADVYVFNNVNDHILWSNVQRRALNPESRKRDKESIARFEKEIKEIRNSDSYMPIIDDKIIKTNEDYIAEYKWNMTLKGPLTPFYKVYFSLVEQYGGQDELIKMEKAQGEMPTISYYEPSELGELANCMTENSAASACFEDSTGAYMITIAPPKNLAQLKGNTAEQKRHKGQLGYEVAYIPRSAYPKITPPKLTPTKVTPINPNSLPDSDRNLNSLAPVKKTFPITTMPSWHLNSSGLL